MTDMQPLKAVLFDLGGTLVTVDRFSLVSTGIKGGQNAFRKLREAGAELPSSVVFYQKVMTTLGKVGLQAGGEEEVKLDEKIAELFESLGKPLTDEQLRIAVAAWHEPFSTQVHAREGVRPLLESLRDRGLRLGVVSNSSWPGWIIRDEIAAHGLEGLLDPVVVSSEIGIRKPHPSIFTAALQAAGTEATETAFVGDRLKEDVAGARFVGIRTVYYNVSDEPDDAGLADAEIQELGELTDVVDRWCT